MFVFSLLCSKVGKYTVVDDKKCLNLASHNYLGMTEEQCLEEKAIKCLHKYGVGSCGPRGFYGTVGESLSAAPGAAPGAARGHHFHATHTNCPASLSLSLLTDIHLHLEAKIAKFLRVEEAVLYSYGFSAIASAIPAYSKVGDIIFVDEAVHFAIQKGLTASRSKIKLFKHNDVKDLARILDEQAKIDAKNPKKAAATRKFMVVEGLYMKTGDICPLPEIIELKKKHKIRLFLDESFSFGTLGEHGRGVTEHFNIPVEDIDHISGSLENAIGAYGGFCAGTTFIVDHQRLSGLGYCFSASLPPLQAAVALGAIDIIENSTDLLSNLRKNSESFHSLIAQCEIIQIEGLMISPVKHLRFRNRSADCHRETQRLERVVEKVSSNHFLQPSVH